MRIKQISLHNGYTLIEMLVVMSIIGILAMVAIPSFSTTIKQDRIISTANELMSVYKLARSEAVKRESTVELKTVRSTKWQVYLDSAVLNEFENDKTGVTVGLVDLSINSTGETQRTNILISDNDSETSDRCLRIYVSGQSKLEEGSC